MCRPKPKDAHALSRPPITPPFPRRCLLEHGGSSLLALQALRGLEVLELVEVQVGGFPGSASRGPLGLTQHAIQTPVLICFIQGACGVAVDDLLCRLTCLHSLHLEGGCGAAVRAPTLHCLARMPHMRHLTGG